MSKVYESIMIGLKEAVEEARSGNKNLKGKNTTVISDKKHGNDLMKKQGQYDELTSIDLQYLLL